MGISHTRCVRRSRTPRDFMKGADVPNQDPRPMPPEGSFHAQERMQDTYAQRVPDPTTPYGYQAQNTTNYGGAAYGDPNAYAQGGYGYPQQPPAPAPRPLRWRNKSP